MAITSEDIQNQSFSIDRKGYDVDEVDEFLEHVADEIDEMNGVIADLEAQLDRAQAAQPYDDASRFDGFDTPATIEPVEDEPAVTVAMRAVEAVEPEIVEEETPSASDAEKDARIAELERLLAEKRADDSAISQALIIAQRSADEIVANAKGEAADIVANARAERNRILDKAEAERQKVQDSITQLEESREEIRDDYQDMLSDFITEASRRLAEIGGTNPVASAHARLTPARIEASRSNDETSSSSQLTGQVPLNVESSSAYSVPQQPGAVPAAATPVVSTVEKDFSGFGDADEFEFDEID